MYSLRKVWRNIVKNMWIYLLFLLQLAAGLSIIIYVQCIEVSEKKAIRQAVLENPENEVMIQFYGNLGMLQNPLYAYEDLEYFSEKYADVLKMAYAYKYESVLVDDSGNVLRAYHIIYASQGYLERLGLMDNKVIYAGYENYDYAVERYGGKVVRLEDVVGKDTELWHQDPYSRYLDGKDPTRMGNVPVTAEYVIVIPMTLVSEEEWPMVYSQRVVSVSLYFRDTKRAGTISKEITRFLQERQENDAAFYYYYYSPLNQYIQQCKGHDVILYLPEMRLIGLAMMLVLTMGMGGILSVFTYRRRRQMAVAMAMGAEYKQVIAEYVGEIALVCMLGFAVSVVAGYNMLALAPVPFYDVHYQPEAVLVAFVVTAAVIFFTALVSLGGITYRNLVRLLREE